MNTHPRDDASQSGDAHDAETPGGKLSEERNQDPPDATKLCTTMTMETLMDTIEAANAQIAQLDTVAAELSKIHAKRLKVTLASLLFLLGLLVPIFNKQLHLAIWTVEAIYGVSIVAFWAMLYWAYRLGKQYVALAATIGIYL